ncbi:MAG TPA: ACT domain-containing protein [Mycobacteriales bacterium]|nr:ACT domain-containing protein [Mycobacteriales bacterium]
MLLRARVSVLDRPGALLSMAKVIADTGGNIVDIEVLASADGRVIDDLVVDLPDGSREGLAAKLRATGAEVLNVRRTVQLNGQRRDLDLLARMAGNPTEAVVSFVALAPSVWSADWAAAVTDSGVVVNATPGAPSPLPDSLPEPIGPLPRRATVRTAEDRSLEVVGVPWAGLGAERIYLGRADGPTFLQVELVHLRRVVELAVGLTGAVLTA